MSDESAANDEERPIRQVVGGAKFVLAGRVVKLIVTFLAQVVLARILGTTSFGGVTQAFAVRRIASVVGKLGLGSGVTRQFAHFEDEPEKARGVVRAGVFIGLVSTGLVATILVLTAPTIASAVFDDPDLTIYFRIVAVGLPFGFLSSIAVSLAKASRDASTHTYVNQLLSPILKSVLKGGLVLAGFGAIGAVAGQVVGTIVVTFLALVLAWRAIPISLRGPSTPMYRHLLTFSLPLLFASSMNMLIGDIDTFLVGVLSTSSAVGLYEAAFTLRPFVLVFFFPATFLLPPVLTRLQKEQRSAEAVLTYQAISKWTTLASFPLFALLFLFPEVVIRTAFSASYVPAANALRVLAFSMLINVALGANDRAVVALGHNRITMYVAVFAATTNGVLNFLLIPQLGILGAALGSATAFMSRDVINTVLLYRWYGLTPLSLVELRTLAAVSVLSAVGYAGYVSLFPARFLPVTLAGLAFLAIYVPLVARLGISEGMDYELFQEIEESQDWDLTPIRRAVQWVQSL